MRKALGSFTVLLLSLAWAGARLLAAAWALEFLAGRISRKGGPA